MMRLVTVFVLLLVLLGTVRAAGEDTVKLPYLVVSDGPVRVAVRRIDRRATPLTVGDRVQLELTVRHPRAIEVSAPFIERADDFVVTDQKRTIRYQGDTVLEVYQLTMAVFAVGEAKLPPFLVTYRDVSGLVASASDSLALTVKSVLPDKMEDINDLNPQVEFPNLLPLWVFLGALAGLGLVFLLWRFFFRRPEKEGAVVTLTPWEEAEQALARIPVAEWLGSGQLKRYYYTVSEIVKRYLTRRFGFPAVDQTSSEILREMRTRRLPGVERFGAFFLNADLVKYAKFVPPAPERLLDEVRALIALTIPEEQPVLAEELKQGKGG